MGLSNWTRYPKIANNYFTFKNLEELKKLFKANRMYIPYGNGRSYSDCCLNEHIIYCKNYNYLLDFDKEKGEIQAQGGVLLSEVLEVIVPKGWFLKVTPGTKYITLGGAIAADVHGKNHHIDGCFSEAVLEFKLLLPSGDVICCKKGDELFHATCGGLGLTGIIIDARIQLKRIKSKNIKQITIKTRNFEETLDVFEKFANAAFSVAWMDCFSKGREKGRGIFMAGDFVDDGDLEYRSRPHLNIPFDLPSLILNKFTIRVFNFLYYKKIRDEISEEVVDIDKFFYPLDSIENWNRIYGRRGFLQYQFILPKNKSYEGIEEILWTIAKHKKTPFLAVLKLHGKENNNLLSFPLEGYSLALDFKIEKGIFKLMEELDKIVSKYGGRLNLYKDARVSREMFENGYHKAKIFREVRKKYELYKYLQSRMSARLSI